MTLPEKIPARIKTDGNVTFSFRDQPVNLFLQKVEILLRPDPDHPPGCGQRRTDGQKNERLDPGKTFHQWAMDLYFCMYFCEMASLTDLRASAYSVSAKNR